MPGFITCFILATVAEPDQLTIWWCSKQLLPSSCLDVLSKKVIVFICGERLGIVIKIAARVQLRVLQRRSCG